VKHFLKYFIALALLTTACDPEDSKPTDSGLAYFPLQTGNFYVYDVEETVYSEVAPTKNLQYQLKIEVTDSFPNTEGGYTYVLNRTKRTDANEAWVDLDTWSVRSNDREVILNEGNISFVRISFPIVSGKKWDGNKYNNQDKDEYLINEIGEIGKSFESSGTTYENTFTVVQEDNEDFIVFLDKRQEVYAKNIGLVYKETTQLNYCTSNDCIGQQKVKSGVIYKQNLNQYVVQ
jgi:hypothetical protein